MLLHKEENRIVEKDEMQLSIGSIRIPFSGCCFQTGKICCRCIML